MKHLLVVHMKLNDVNIFFRQEFRETRDNESETLVYQLWRVEEFPFLKRSKSEAGLKINGIRKIHQLSLTSEGIRSRKLSCMDCPASSLCLACKQQKIIFSAEKIKTVIVASAAEDDSDESDEEAIVDIEQGENEEGGYEDSGDESGDVAEGHDLGPGDIVWVFFNKRWIAGKIVSLSDITSTALTRQLKSNSTSTSLVKFYHDGTFHRSANSKIELLAQNLVDQHRARFHPTSYLEALADLSYG